LRTGKNRLAIKKKEGGPGRLRQISKGGHRTGEESGRKGGQWDKGATQAPRRGQKGILSVQTSCEVRNWLDGKERGVIMPEV